MSNKNNFRYIYDNPKKLDLIEYMKDLEEKDQPDACDIDDDECESCGC
jgi:hypothetical protein